MDSGVRVELLTCPFVTRGPGHPVLWKVAEKNEGVLSRVLFITLLCAIVKLLPLRGRYEVIRFHWGHFRASLKNDNLKHYVSSIKPETIEFV